MWYCLYFQFLFIQLSAFIDDQWEFDKAGEEYQFCDF